MIGWMETFYQDLRICRPDAPQEHWLYGCRGYLSRHWDWRQHDRFQRAERHTAPSTPLRE